MKITVSQQDPPATLSLARRAGPPATLSLARRAGKKLLVAFRQGKTVNNYRIDKAEDFLICIDKFIRKRKIGLVGFIGQIGHIEFHHTGLLTERIIRAIILGFSFNM
ncbi:MAG: hypothetical protein Q8P06_00455 [Candidatus Azambacteria bacterium]|nr:hypothetical protein [Candidatus Azambacteria bacterium]